MMHEAELHQGNMFVTLTYDDEHLPWEVNKRDAQLYLKKLRKRLTHPIKYYLAAEYGKETQRAHMHLIIFGLIPCEKCRVCSKLYTGNLKAPKKGTDCHAAEEAWGKGIVTGGTVTAASTRYVADYIQKDTTLDDDDPRQRPFALMSKGLGNKWRENNIDLQTCFLGLNQGTRRAPLPRYYQKKVIEGYGEDSDQVKFLINTAKQRHSSRVQKSREQFWATRGGYTHGQISAAFQQNREQLTRDRLKEAKL